MNKIYEVGIINYGAGNIQSVKNALNALDVRDIKVLDEKFNPLEFKRLILPGVGAFGDAMVALKSKKLDECIKEFIGLDRPFLGICLGMQLLFERSFEFKTHAGLGVLKGEIVKFHTKFKIPHVGWNKLNFSSNSALKDGYFYFTHSYHAVCDDEIVLAKTVYDYEFVSAVRMKNLVGIQPHPEKSANVGIEFLKRFMEL
ncbi:MAG: imidazole glycerol phosphate synthase subunit HisH [Campylobacter sp.]|nr:imidazole glycerol phosphate synthase subunit HisH [Campylobacter sp.]